MAGDYSSHADYMAWVSEEADVRCEQMTGSLRNAFSPFIEIRSVEVIVFSSISAVELGKIMVAFPDVVKPILNICNVAARAIERDLGIRGLDTYSPKFKPEEASALAGYIKRYLPLYVEIPTLCCIDRTEFIDKEIRKRKGRWEQCVVEALNRYSRFTFKKRKFRSDGEQFELDAGTPVDGGVDIGVDVKRIEARRDIHKRSDEIVNKGSKLKQSFPGAKFAAVVYYPFVDEHVNVQHRLQSANVDAVVFAGETEESVQNAVRMLLAHLGASK